MSQHRPNNPEARRRARAARIRAGKSVPPHMLHGIEQKKPSPRSLWLKVLVGLAAVLLIATFLLTVVSAVAGVAAANETVKQYKELEASLPNAAIVTAQTFQTTRIYDRDGILLQEIADQDFGWRTFIPYDKMSPYLIDATIAAEDATFWNHRGVEPMAFGRILAINLGGQGQSGGSTITQQLVRALHPDQIGNAPTVGRKWREMLAAVALEQQYSKTDILTMYINQIFYGNRSYGAEAAAQTFFHKHASELTLSEASLLAGIPQQPTNFNPSLYPDRAKARQRYVLDQMVKLGYVSRSEANAAYLDFPLIYPARDGDGAVLDHPHFVQYVYEYLAENYPDRDFSKGGLNIYTTISKPVQEMAEQVVQENIASLYDYSAKNASATIIFPPTGEILAMVGSADFENAAIEGQVNIATSPQQPGSAIKPIVYAAAFEQGWTPGTVILDAPFRIETPNAIDPITGERMPYYEPENYNRTFNGAVSARKALSNSLNIPAVKAASYAGGPTAVIDIARRMGMKHALDQSPDEYGLSIALGSGDIWPLELTNAYATFANTGKYVPATPILRITDGEGRVMYELDRANALLNAEQAIRPEIAYQVTSILTDNESRSMIFGSDNRFGETQRILGRPTAAKSGTTNDWRDIWTQGYTTDLAVGVWVGNTRNEPLAQIDGIQGAGPIWQRIMIAMHETPEFAALLVDPSTGQPIPIDFPVPSGIERGVICDATGGRPVNQQDGNVGEVLIKGGAPANRCDQLTPWQYADLVSVMSNLSGDMPFTKGAIDSIRRYAAAVRYDGEVVEPTFSVPLELSTSSNADGA